MKVGIRFADNDFHQTLSMFMNLYILPTFIEREDGHMVTHLTTSQIVDMFNMYAWHIYRFNLWERNSHSNVSLYDTPVYGMDEYLMITDMNVYWDNKTDTYLADWNGWNNGEFHWTDGKQVYTS